MSTSQVEQALWELADANAGRLTPDLVLEAASDPDSPLHSYFTWDDAEAAHKRRLDEARTLIRAVKVEVKTKFFTLHAPAFVRDPRVPAEQQGYTSLGRLKSDEDMAREAVVSEFARAAAALNRARSVATALDLVEAIDELTDRVGILRDRVQTVQQAAA